ncbi:efflux RND transporter periplasmic adaptor subunit [Thiorhodococcus mannitoliphagus]|uniref:Efflux RND transporter periplasmic adaptor subunit n=1 Tax=Thiorhodococcus mannitoliphagus TaxID=329406 RepID=A0A6P1DS18_9GAMM|nr:efflux RND transporter periplasmic adaptor subunit [Thiorhodococcus mannitoliphagus]NEX19721.1 efflux RND transporter periplasmic adaptor subunit [Thiorhodococcus mannitoliphagus]
MSAERHDRKHRWLILPPIAIGVGILVWMAQGREPPAQAEQGEIARPVRVIEAPAVELVPTAEGYGPVRPARVWKAVAQVAGRIIEIHPRLRDGEILAAGTELVRIDPIDYELALAQAQAELAELRVQEQNTRASLEIEERNRELANQELERLRKLAGKGTASASDVDQAERTALTSNSAAQNLRNTLTLIPTQRQVLETQVARAERDLGRTRILAPFDLRVANLAVEADQYVGVGQTLFEGDSVDRVEIDVQVPLYSLRRLFIGMPTPDLSQTSGQLDPTRLNELLSKLVGLDPLVRLDLGNSVAEWQAEFVRMDDQVDPQTRTMGVVVAVDRSFDKVIPGERPPLSKGMFVQVLLRGRAQGPRVVVPRNAVRDGAVYLVDAEQRLRRQPVEVLFNQGDYSVIGAGLTAGQQVVLSDLVPAVDGMLLDPQPDLELAAELQALGDAP